MRNYEVVKFSSRKGQRLYESGSRYAGRDLRQVYNSWSDEKEEEYNKCLADYLETPEHDAFSICSANTFTFTVSWVGLYNSRNALFFITKSHNYVVLLDD